EHLGRVLHGDRRQGARREHAPDPEPAREDQVRGEHRLVRGPLPAAARARRRADRARRAAPGVAAAEVPVKFAEPLFLFGALVALVVAALLVAGAFGLRRAVARFGDPARVQALVTASPATRRAWKGVLLVLAVALAFVAAARPQYGEGTRL